MWESIADAALGAGLQAVLGVAAAADAVHPHASRALLQATPFAADPANSTSPVSTSSGNDSDHAHGLFLGLLFLILIAGIFGLVLFVVSMIYGISGIVIAKRSRYPAHVDCLCWGPNGRDACCDIRVSNVALACANAIAAALGVISLNPVWAAFCMLACAINIWACVALRRAARNASPYHDGHPPQRPAAEMTGIPVFVAQPPAPVYGSGNVPASKPPDLVMGEPITKL